MVKKTIDEQTSADVELDHRIVFANGTGKMRKDILGHVLDYATHTGILQGLTKSVNAGDDKLFDIEAGEGIIIDRTDPINPVLTRIIFPQTLGITDPNLTDALSHVYIDITGTVIVRNTSPTQTNLEEELYLGGQVHDTAAQIILFPIPDPVIAYGTSATEIVETVLSGGRTLEGGFLFPSGAMDLTLAITAATVNQWGRNFVNNPGDPNITPIPPRVIIPASNFFKVFDDGAGSLVFFPQPTTDVLEPTLMNLNGAGTLVALQPGRYSIIRVFISAGDENVVFYYGTQQYMTLIEAQAAIETTFVENEATFSISPIAKIFIEEGVTDLTAGLLAGTVVIQRITSRTQLV